MITPAIILFLLIAPLGFRYLSGRRACGTDLTKALFQGLGCAFLFFAVGHFARTDGMVAMLPPWFMWRESMVYLTGGLECLVGLGLFWPRYRCHAAVVAVVILVCFFPVNIYAAYERVGLGGHQWGPVYLWVRAPLQALLVAWAWYALSREKSLCRRHGKRPSMIHLEHLPSTFQGK